MAHENKHKIKYRKIQVAMLTWSVFCEQARMHLQGIQLRLLMCHVHR